MLKAIGAVLRLSKSEVSGVGVNKFIFRRKFFFFNNC